MMAEKLVGQVLAPLPTSPKEHEAHDDHEKHYEILAHCLRSFLVH